MAPGFRCKTCGFHDEMDSFIYDDATELYTCPQCGTEGDLEDDRDDWIRTSEKRGDGK
jgi:hypothetical protein